MFFFVVEKTQTDKTQFGITQSERESTCITPSSSLLIGLFISLEVLKICVFVSFSIRLSSI